MMIQYCAIGKYYSCHEEVVFLGSILCAVRSANRTAEYGLITQISLSYIKDFNASRPRLTLAATDDFARTVTLFTFNASLHCLM